MGWRNAKDATMFVLLGISLAQIYSMFKSTDIIDTEKKILDMGNGEHLSHGKITP